MFALTELGAVPAGVATSCVAWPLHSFGSQVSPSRWNPVDSNIRYPTDSSLLQDGVRVLTRAVNRLKAECAAGAVKMVDHTRATKHRVLEITRAAKAFSDGGRAKLEEGYRGLLGIVQGVVRRAKEIVHSVDAGRVKLTGSINRVVASQARIEHFAPLVEKVIAQAKARVFGGNIRQAALGDALVPYAERVDHAVARVLRSRASAHLARTHRQAAEDRDGRRPRGDQHRSVPARWRFSAHRPSVRREARRGAHRARRGHLAVTG